MDTQKLKMLGLVFLIAITAASLFALSVIATPSAADSCKDSIKGCKNPKWIGSGDNCTCWQCENGSVVCTADTTDKLSLYEAAAKARGPEVNPNTLSEQAKIRLFDLLILRQTYDRNINGPFPPFGPTNTNAGNQNANTNQSPFFNPRNRSNANMGPTLNSNTSARPKGGERP